MPRAEQARSTRLRAVAGLVLAVVVALALWWLEGPPATPDGDRPAVTATDPSARPSTRPSTQPGDGGSTDAPGGAVTDPASGLPVVALSTLPREAARILDLIEAGGPFPEPRRDGTVFENRERLLPRGPEGYYREYTVPTPGSADRGARRIVAGEDGERYWTADHYESFALIDPGR